VPPNETVRSNQPHLPLIGWRQAACLTSVHMPKGKPLNSLHITSGALGARCHCQCCRSPCHDALRCHCRPPVTVTVWGDSHMLLSKGCKGLGGLPCTENRENNQSAFRLPSG
jgi:hypothetical protein